MRSDNFGKVLVVGDGFIGKHVRKKFIDLSCDVTVLTRGVGSGSYDKKVDRIVADYSVPGKWQEDLRNQKFNVVVNCSGEIDHSSFFKNGEAVIRNHFSTVVNLVNSVDRNHLNSFLQLGSSDEYGSQISPQKETMRELPFSSYSFGKVAASHFLQMLNRSEGFPVTVFRLFLVYGPNQNNDRFLPQIISKSLNGETFPTSAGEQIRDFCYIDDVCTAVIRALQVKEAIGEIFNIASGIPIQIKEVIRMISTLVGKGTPDFGALPYRTGENMSLYADITKAKRLLGWEPITRLETGLLQTINFYRK
ncbi:NAD-dependent epimerase/dehydratase family protein [Leptospira gomenensis]|uniref:NAD-dependent epimerase/dehydratase family protein n=1 Tax=Leptospira gomenensis TaxID=2484974 RepID=A0A5F1Z0M6_9LEPT|nr:NAD-dependent epimerase/dehydratase family protein [Leptospira gomenensis]TGK30917.1 NAD-dependent epimerase/dehydratase family protein [Leptospira gomenensis]TGK32555.1 NAD-dependent epimerase/dehydratase family protein [Leptospira gomenensis]TGK45363.1 NAD-dependent epimerase/dehydratase family protein [Leptospira gomenensis]TGK66276.1 NAD-dependent epimerase/dehydratase family protein [Leptospira gomenensis]